MPANARSTKRPEVRCDRSERGDCYTGTKKELIAARICDPKWFPKKLQPELKKDGTPYIGNNGKPRIRRTYHVEGHSPSTTLMQRIDRNGIEYWVVHIAITEEESERRRQALRREQEENERRYEEKRQSDMQSRQRAAAPSGPGADAPIQSRAAFDVGDRAVRYAPDGPGHLERVVVVEGYGFHGFNVGGGQIERQWGYVVSLPDGTLYFAYPHQLREYADKPFHIRLAAST